VASGEMLNALAGSVTRRSRLPLWVGALAFVVVTAGAAIGLVSVAIGVLATLRVAYTTAVERVPRATSATEQTLTDRRSVPPAAMAVAPVTPPGDPLAHPLVAPVPGSPSVPRGSLSPPTAQPPVVALPDDTLSAGKRPIENTGGSTEAPSPPAAAAASHEGGEEGGGSQTATAALAAGSPASLAPAAGAGASVPRLGDNAPPPGSPPALEGAAAPGVPETDEIGRLANAPLPVAMTAAALSHPRHALKHRNQTRVVKHAAVHKPAPHTPAQNTNFRPFDPFQPVPPPSTTTWTHQKTW
jgi:hypothetical protein